MREAWDRLAGEPTRAYAAFQCYMKLPPEKREFLAAYRTMYPGAQRVSRQWREWKQEFDWDGRADAYWDRVYHDRHEAQREGMKLEAFRQGEEMEAQNRRIIESMDLLYDKIRFISEQDLTNGQFNLGHMATLLRANVEATKHILGLREEREKKEPEESEEEALQREIAELTRGEG